MPVASCRWAENTNDDISTLLTEFLSVVARWVTVFRVHRSLLTDFHGVARASSAGEGRPPRPGRPEAAAASGEPASGRRTARRGVRWWCLALITSSCRTPTIQPPWRPPPTNYAISTILTISSVPTRTGILARYALLRHSFWFFAHYVYSIYKLSMGQLYIGLYINLYSPKH